MGAKIEAVPVTRSACARPDAEPGLCLQAALPTSFPRAPVSPQAMLALQDVSAFSAYGATVSANTSWAVGERGSTNEPRCSHRTSERELSPSEVDAQQHSGEPADRNPRASARKRGRGRKSGSGGGLICQVPGCSVPLDPGTLRPYNIRYRY